MCTRLTRIMRGLANLYEVLKGVISDLRLFHLTARFSAFLDGAVLAARVRVIFSVSSSPFCINLVIYKADCDQFRSDVVGLRYISIATARSLAGMPRACEKPSWTAAIFPVGDQTKVLHSLLGDTTLPEVGASYEGCLRSWKRSWKSWPLSVPRPTYYKNISMIEGLVFPVTSSGPRR